MEFSQLDDIPKNIIHEILEIMVRENVFQHDICLVFRDYPTIIPVLVQVYIFNI
jgi:hypothetical protein